MASLPAINVMDEKAARLACIRLLVTCGRGEAAELLGISPKTFDDWRERGIVPPPIPQTRRWAVATLLRRFEGAQETGKPSPATDLQVWKAGRGQT